MFKQVVTRIVYNENELVSYRFMSEIFQENLENLIES